MEIYSLFRTGCFVGLSQFVASMALRGAARALTHCLLHIERALEGSFLHIFLLHVVFCPEKPIHT